VDRSNGKVKIDHPFKPLITLDVKSYKAEDCPLCKSGTKAVKPGSRK